MSTDFMKNVNKKGHFDKLNCYEIFKIWFRFPSYSGVHSSWVFCRIPFIADLRCNEFKRLIIPEHSKNGVTDYVHDSPDGSNFFCWHICGRNNRKWLGSRAYLRLWPLSGCWWWPNVGALGKAGIPLGQVNSVPMELAGIIYARFIPK